MIQLIRSRLYPEDMEIMYRCPAFSSEVLDRDFEIKGGKWYTDEEGWLIGENRENFAAMVMSKGEYFGDVLVEFDAATVLPATRDINVTWHGEWDEEKNARGIAYVAGIEGWWQGMVGFEKSPVSDYFINTKLLDFVPGKIYHMTVGNIKNDIFIAIDNVLALEIYDPEPMDYMKYGKIGFEAYCTKVKYRNLTVRKAKAVSCCKPYDPEF
ncbi:MAG: hypothetical protein Q4F31_08630 [Eubacteriales bacterium]|nr:hypothetical protein [Eubacteriales bacterium]